MCFTNGINPKFEFLHDFLENFKQIGRAWCKHHFACDCAPCLCKIWGHLNNGRWINGREVANWGSCDRSTCIVVPQLSEWPGHWYRKIISSILLFSWTVYLKHWCHKWRFQKILSNFELVMNFGRSGQTTVDQSLWIVYATFRLIHQIVFCGHNVMFHHTITFFTWC